VYGKSVHVHDEINVKIPIFIVTTYSHSFMQLRTFYFPLRPE